MTIGLLAMPLSFCAAGTHAGPLRGAGTPVRIDIAETLEARQFSAEEEARRQVLATDDRRTKALRQGESAPLTDLESTRVRYQLVDAGERSVRIYGDIAIVLARDKYVIWQGGEQVGGAVQFTRTYKRIGADWRAVSTRGTFMK